MSAISTYQKDRFDDQLEAWRNLFPGQDLNAMPIIDRFLQIANIIEKTDVYGSEIAVLSALYRSGEAFQLSPKKLMQSADLTSGAMTALLNRLEKMKLIFRKNDTKDGRISLAVLTPKGIRVIDKVILQRIDKTNMIIEIFDDFEKRQFSHFLKKILKYLDEED